MSSKTAKLSRKIGKKSFDQKARSALIEYTDRIAEAKFWTRLRFAWKVLLGKNPHTGKRP